MKQTILIIGLIAILLNTIFGVIISSYEQFNIALVDISILLSIALISSAFSSELADGFKIGLSFAYVFSGLARIFLSLMTTQEVSNNISLLILVSVFAFELALFGGIKFLNSK